MASIQLLRNKHCTPPRSNRVALLVIDNSLIGIYFKANSTRNSFSDAVVLADRMISPWQHLIMDLARPTSANENARNIFVARQLTQN